jgi:aspartate-semialdehyde dehydrogenase
MAKIPVSILAATGAVGQRFVQLLSDHPLFEIASLAASERSAGKTYAEAVNWVLPGGPPPAVGKMKVQEIDTNLEGRLAFSALPASVAYEVEPRFAEAGYVVCSNASAYRTAPDVPLLIPEVNSDHIELLKRQRAERGWEGLLVTSPNCTATGVVIPLKPLDAAFGVKRVFIASMQAISGAGYPGVASLDITDNVIPHIGGEEDKIEEETRLMLGKIVAGKRVPLDAQVTAHSNRVPVVDGHTVCLSVGFENPPSVDDAIQALENFRGTKVVQNLPGAPERPIWVTREPDRPQPRRDRDNGKGMVVTVGRVRPCNLLDLRLVSVSHNTLRGAASGSILNAELLVAEGYLT